LNGGFIVLCGKIVLVSGFCSIVTWIAVYSRLAAWWRNPVGRALVTAKLLVAALFALSILGSVFHLTGLFIEWLTVVLIGAMTPVMLWRTAVWLHLNRTGRLPRDEHAASKRKVREEQQ
jgi:hypothetical protein